MSTNIVKSSEIRFKNYDQAVCLDVPVYVKDLIEENALAQIIDELVEGIALSELSVYYSAYGCPAYHPKMLLKVWLYGYCTKVYTSRPLAQKLREDLVFIWLSGGQRPCFKTLCSFRSSRMLDLMNPIFKHLLMYLLEHGYIDEKDLYVDGSKWQAHANKYKLTWRKNIERYKGWALDRIDALFEEIKTLQQAEDAQYGSKDLPRVKSKGEISVVLSSEDLHSHLRDLNELVAAESDKKRQRKYASIGRKLVKEQEKLEKYEEQEAIMGSRNSYAKTEEDATGLRMKDDQLLPGYNPQITTSNQFILHATIHQNAADSPTLKPHLAGLEEHMQALVEAQVIPEKWQDALTADAGYGSEENYEYLQTKGFEAYVKYGMWYREYTGQIQQLPFHPYNWPYDPETDSYRCPQGQILTFREEITRITDNGYPKLIRVYEAQTCQGCPFWEKCRNKKAKPESNRILHKSPKWEQFIQEARERLASEKGVEKRSQRGVDVETPFANIKYNMGHRRFILQGLDKVQIEFRFLALAHNIKKIYCQQTGCWKEHYANRAAKKVKKGKKRA